MNFWIPAFAGAALVFGLLGFRRFETDVARDIRERLSGAHRAVTVRSSLDLRVLGGRVRSVTLRASQFSTDTLPLYTEPTRPTDGRVDHLVLDLSDFLIGGLHVERLNAEIPNCRFDLGLALRHHKIRLSRSGIGTGAVSIRDHDLEAFVLEKFHDIKRATIRIDHGRIHVEGHGTFLLLDTDFEIDANLITESGSDLDLSEAQIKFDGVPTDASTASVLLNTLNPIVDLNRDLHLGGAIRISGIELAGGVLRVSGKTTIPVRPRD